MLELQAKVTGEIEEGGNELPREISIEALQVSRTTIALPKVGEGLKGPGPRFFGDAATLEDVAE